MLGLVCFTAERIRADSFEFSAAVWKFASLWSTSRQTAAGVAAGRPGVGDGLPGKPA